MNQVARIGSVALLDAILISMSDALKALALYREEAC